ncbi:AAA family ATPase [Methylotenera sp.]|uniref:AAA family ATPase n=1 Tax=Methylotenera sp. TaxID=2051956 RepID=UPI00248968CF|nr:AAA family ATPase [Methylotenera sp.]MDI1298351.1 AAA family ATPase [Methylotenera sp.]
MYYPHFGLKEPPFKITPNTDFFFSGGNRGAVLDALVYAITNGEGIIKVVGEVGSGKTMLCRMLQTILPEKIESIYLANPSVAPEDVLHAIAFELQLKVPKNSDRLKVMQLLQAHLLNRHAEGRQVVIFVEEAQGMPLATLEEIRLLSNLETKQDKLLQIVLFGQPELDANLSETHIRQLRERITHSFHLEPLGTKDIGEYLILRLRAAGYHGPHLFSEAAIKKLSAAAEGLARRVNILADKSLLAAYADNVYQVTPKHVKAAIQDSEFGRKTTNYKQYFIGASVLIGLLAIAIGYAWWQYQHQPKVAVVKNVVVAAQPKKVKVEASAPALNTPVASNITVPNPNAAVVEPTTTVSLASPAVPASVVQPTLNNQVATAPAATFVAPTATPTAPVNIAETKTLVDKRLEVTRSHLLSAAPSTITLQIKSLPTDAKLSGEQKKDDQLKAELDRISQQLEIDNIYLYRKTQNGETYTVILYGEFAERNEALAALKNLPISIKNNKPYLRTFAGINKDIDQTQ